MLCAIWYHLCYLKKVKSIHGGVLLLVKLLLKVTFLHGYFSSCINGAKSCNAPHFFFRRSILKRCSIKVLSSLLMRLLCQMFHIFHFGVTQTLIFYKQARRNWGSWWGLQHVPRFLLKFTIYQLAVKRKKRAKKYKPL